MNRTITSAAVLSAALLLAGCSNASTPEATPTPTPEPNASACADFADATSRLADALDGAGNWEALRDDMDGISLRAEGDVKARITNLVASWPEAASIVVYREYGDINSAIGDVSRACEAAGYPVDVHTFAE